jgi:hypothetical protein
MRCIQYATGEYLVYNEAIAIALSGYRQTDHVGVSIAEDRPLSEDEVLDHLLDLNAVQVEDNEHLDDHQRKLLENISIHHPAFRHKVEALGFAFSYLIEAKPKKRQAKKDALRRAREEVKDIPPADRNKDTSPKPHELPKGTEVDKEGKEIAPAPAPESNSPPGFKEMQKAPKKTPQPSFWKELIKDFTADDRYNDELRKKLERDYSKFKDFKGAEKILKKMEDAYNNRKGDSPKDHEETVKHLMDLMDHDSTWMDFLEIEDPHKKKIKVAKSKKNLLHETSPKSGAVMILKFSDLKKLFEPDMYQQLVKWNDAEAVANSVTLELSNHNLEEQIDVLWVDEKPGQEREVGLSMKRGQLEQVAQKLGIQDYEAIDAKGNPIVEDKPKEGGTARDPNIPSKEELKGLE